MAKKLTKKDHLFIRDFELKQELIEQEARYVMFGIYIMYFLASLCMLIFIFMSLVLLGVIKII